jgi:poly(glycerol-phosphate) alpha-glucosyltransferase
VCIIPNGIDIPTESTASPPWVDQIQDGKKVLLYLGRLHPKKGLANLLGAWKQARSKSPAKIEPWRLAIAGWSQLGHENELRSLAADYGLNGDVLFLGPLHGEAKAAAYSSADAVVLPSFSEGLPMAVLEAWSYKKPVLMTPQCNLPEGFSANAAFESQPNIDSLANGLALLTEATDEQRCEMGSNGWRLVNEKFTWEHVTSEMLSVYRWLVGGGAPPACVVRT